MVELGKLYIPTVLAFDPDIMEVFAVKSGVISDSYSNSLECTLSLSFSGSHIYIEYHCDDDTYLSDNLGIKEGYIASGDLACDRFEDIQKGALKRLGEFIRDPQSIL